VSDLFLMKKEKKSIKKNGENF